MSSKFLVGVALVAVMVVVAGAGQGQGSSNSLVQQVAALQADVAALQDLLQHFSRNGDDVFIDGANLHVTNGTGTTDGTPNELGNVIIGYNEDRGGGADDRSGSHMLVVGDQNNYSSFGGIVAGRLNTASGNYASVSGGVGNLASGRAATVFGWFNTASGNFSSVSGGNANRAIGLAASISGGQGNRATSKMGSVSGGFGNTAGGGLQSSVSGGRGNTANGSWSSVSGGFNRVVFGNFDWRAGALFQNQ